MAIEEYVNRNERVDYFHPRSNEYFAFPCSSCAHNDKEDTTKPCCHCQHNSGAKAEQEEEPEVVSEYREWEPNLSGKNGESDGVPYGETLHNTTEKG